MLPSVRELAMRHQIHPNTVSQAYRELVDRHFVRRQHGRRMVVRSPGDSITPHEKDLDALIDAMIRQARVWNYTLQELRDRLRERLLAEPPDHVLIVDLERGTAELLRTELSRHLRVAVKTCLLEELSSSPGLGIGALIVCLPGRTWDVAKVLGPGRNALHLEPSRAEPLIARMNQLEEPSLIVLASVSPYVLQIAEGVLAPIAGTRHTIEQFCLNSNETRDFAGADLVVTDSVTCNQVQATNMFQYALVSDTTLERIKGALDPDQEAN
jgi:DNA-binding transcriptional regulator YhcF (GntR family)